LDFFKFKAQCLDLKNFGPREPHVWLHERACSPHIIVFHDTSFVIVTGCKEAKHGNEPTRRAMTATPVVQSDISVVTYPRCEYS